jgi:molecular chaperone Hsp33
VRLGPVLDLVLQQHAYWRGGCLLLQRMPREGGTNRDVESLSPEAEDWTRVMILMETCTPQELTVAEVIPEILLFRLFHEEGVRIYDPQALRHQCRCSQARVEAMLRSLPRDEVEVLAEAGLVTVPCEFCNKGYAFNGKDREAIYSQETSK